MFRLSNFSVVQLKDDFLMGATNLKIFKYESYSAPGIKIPRRERSVHQIS